MARDDYAPDLSHLGQPLSVGDALARALRRTRDTFSPRCPYRVGDTVIGDDPFSGRREGVVVWRDRRSVGVKTTYGVFFFDHRLVRLLD
ncbi:hypothetical protein [Arthrobacter sp. Soil764]|uniref:hypothetical protein n=1 Tax=Arthrobacter sp. Soil764 TaxID=1736403 RepID=UPI0006FE5A47|nr:hypothetical protein [Arthrobacter sp. Soil764]KRE82214.1 hypothetical protein ASG86_11155 [Arthrobacter sp. Soil764]